MEHHKPRMTVEFLAPPGAGKTTVASAVSEKLRDSNHSVIEREAMERMISSWHIAHSPVAQISDYLSFYIRRWKLSFRIGQYIKDLRPKDADIIWRAYRLSRRLHNREIAAEVMSDLPSILLLDQGVMQSLISVQQFSKPQDPRVLGQFLQRLGGVLPDLLVFIDVPGEVIMQRLRDRLERIGPQGNIDAQPDFNLMRMKRLMESCR